VITADGIRSAMARLERDGRPPTIANLASEMRVKTIVLEPLVHQMFRDGQLDRQVDAIREPDAQTTGRTTAEIAAPPGVDRTLARHHGISYLHIPAVDPKQSARFYESVFGWHIDGHDTKRPSFSDGTGHVAGAWMVNHEPSSTPGLLPYIYTDDLPKTAELVETHGGSIVEAPAPEGNLLVATFRDPGGNVLGLWQEVAANDDGDSG
jgi:predicted enzyme related to lactoylglutathione lyase